MTVKLVPITREVLREFYRGHPLDPVPQDAADAHGASLDALIKQLESPNSTRAADLYFETPKRIDDNFWKTREMCEEAAFFLKKIAADEAIPAASKEKLEALIKQLSDAEKAVLHVQESNTAAAAAQIKQFLPQDFRASLIEMKRNTAERANQRAVEDLIKRGGTIRQKYELYLKQQWERREALVQMGNLSGMFKLLVKYLGGIPQVLLDFAKEINAKVGPMEEQRVTYGPDLYRVCTLGIKIDMVCGVWESVVSKRVVPAEEVLDVLGPAVAFYTHHLTRVVEFLGMLFTKSPFFITANEREEAAHHDGKVPSLTRRRSSIERGSHTGAHGHHHTHHTHEGDGEHDGEGTQLQCASSLLAAVGLTHPHGHVSSSGHSKEKLPEYQSAPPALYNSDSRTSRPSLLSMLHWGKSSSAHHPGHTHMHTAPTSQGSETLHTPQGSGPLPDALGPHKSSTSGGGGVPAHPTSRSPPPPPPAAHGAANGVVSSGRVSVEGTPAGSKVALVKSAVLPAGAGWGAPPAPANGGAYAHASPWSGVVVRTDLATVSAEFFSCADNNSWVSSTVYQSSLVYEDHDSTYHDLIERSSVNTSRRSSLGGQGHPGAGPPALPTIFSEAGVEGPVADHRAPRRAPLAGVAASQSEASRQSTEPGGAPQQLTQSELESARGSVGQRAPGGPPSLITDGATVSSRDGTVYVNAPIRGMTGVSDATTAGGGSLRTLDHTSLGLTSVAEEGAGRGPRNARTSSTGLDDTSLASPLANGNAAGGSDRAVTPQHGQVTAL